MAKAKRKAKLVKQGIVTIATARKVRDVVKKGLTSGLGVQEPGKMCVEAAVCYAMGLPHGDNPHCVGSAVRAFKIRLNDAPWSSDQARAKGMLEVAIAQLGSDKIDQRQFADLVVVGVIKEILPIAIRARAKVHPKHAEALEICAVACEAATDRMSARAAARAARDKMWSFGWTWDAAAAADAYDAAADAYAVAAAVAYAAVAYAADAYAAYDAAAVAYAAAYARAAARDSVLSLAAKIAVKALKVCKSQGVKWLALAA